MLMILLFFFFMLFFNHILTQIVKPTIITIQTLTMPSLVIMLISNLLFTVCIIKLRTFKVFLFQLFKNVFEILLRPT